MQNGSERDGSANTDHPGTAEANTRPQQGGEAETTRFGMEDGDNTDIPATGGPSAEDDAPEGS